MGLNEPLRDKVAAGQSLTADDVAKLQRQANPTPVIGNSGAIIGNSAKPQDVLNQRGGTHGDFEVGAQVAQRLKGIMHSSPRWQTMSLVQREALENVTGKLARILTGDPDFLDHYRDIIGYTQLAMDHTAKYAAASDVQVTRFYPNEPKS